MNFERPAAVTRELYPFEDRFVEVAGQRMHYVDEGRGTPVVMVHGNPSWSFYYRDLVRALSSTHRAIALDHIGCGFSAKPPETAYEYTLANRVRDLGLFLDQVVPEGRLDLVVHDWGGMIGFAWAAAHPERIRRLVVLNTAAFPLPPSKPLPFALRLGRDSGLGTALIRGLNAFARGAVMVGTKRRPMPSAVQAAYCAPYDTWDNRIATSRFVQDIPLDDRDRAMALVRETERRLPSLAGCPMFIGWGALDFVFDDHFLRRWQAEFPAAKVHRFADCGHYVLEDAGPELVDEIAAFLRAP